VFAAGEPVRLGKALSTPPNFADGVLDSIHSAAQTMNLSREELLGQTKLFVHGSTVVDNIVLTREGSKVGLITTRGFEDTLLMTRAAYGRWGGLTEDRIKHPVKRLPRSRANMNAPQRPQSTLTPAKLRAATSAASPGS
jgi:N-methylhydantoinase A